ncbi:MAG: TatD family hydrolase [Xanthomonadales bacterium]|nr:TatD family hydrolase [Xanthomonadales bacterium]
MSGHPEPPALVDIGANLTHESFARDLGEVLERARAAGVVQIVVTGADAASSEAALALARRHPKSLFATAGVHPHHARDFGPETEAALRELLQAPEVVAVGETGLDYHRDFAPRPAQLRAFERQVELALATGKPMFLHQREAHEDLVAILKPVRDRLGPLVVHCFTDGRKALFESLDLDCHIGITGWICDERRGRHLLELVRHIPAERLMLETDCPYLLPRDLPGKPRGRRNEPMHLPHILRTVAAARGEAPEALAARTTANARAFFALPAP